jgi:hypothetical protein
MQEEEPIVEVVASAISYDNIYLRPLQRFLVDRYLDMLAAGKEFPPVLLDAEGDVLVDGRHRISMWQRAADDPDVLIPARRRRYRSRVDVQLDTMLGNAHHGERWSIFDLTRIVTQAELDEIPAPLVRQALGLSERRYELLRARRAYDADGAAVPLKHSTAWMAGQRLSATQVRTNRALSLDILRHARDLTALLREAMVDLRDEQVALALSRLRDALQGALP